MKKTYSTKLTYERPSVEYWRIAKCSLLISASHETDSENYEEDPNEEDWGNVVRLR